MFFIIHIQSKNRNSLQKFLKIFFFKKLNKKIKINSVNKFINYKTKKKFFTVLKSPHVNKIAQEQFEYRLYTKKVKVYSNQFFLFLILLKKINVNLFSDLNFKIELILNKKITFKKFKNQFNLDNYMLLELDENGYEFALKNYLKILNKYGNFVLLLK